MTVHIRPMGESELEDMMAEHESLNPDLPIRQDTLDALTRYVDQGIEPGGFLLACLCNDLMGAFARADSYNRATLFQICQYIYGELPARAHGSPERVSAWLRQFRGESDETES